MTPWPTNINSKSYKREGSRVGPRGFWDKWVYIHEVKSKKLHLQSAGGLEQNDTTRENSSDEAISRERERYDIRTWHFTSEGNWTLILETSSHESSLPFSGNSNLPAKNAVFFFFFSWKRKKKEQKNDTFRRKQNLGGRSLERGRKDTWYLLNHGKHNCKNPEC